MKIYLDNAATTPLDEEVIAAMHHAMQNVYGNPSSIHAQGRKARTTVEDARKVIAKYLNASIGEIFFTSCGTESNNMALKCAVRDLGVKRIISSPIEHHCILHTVQALENHQNIQLDFVKLDANGCPDYAHLESLLQNSEAQTMVSLMHGNNEIGTLIDLDKVADLCSEYGALFHSDTVQTMGQYPIDVDATKINFLSGSAHKFHGPKGAGFIYINNDNIVKPFLDGGAQERNMRAGTENIYGIVGLAKALELSYENLETRKTHITALKAHMKSELLKHFEDIQFNGAGDNSMYKVLSVSFPPSPKMDLLLLNLDIAGICASGGSACSSGVDIGSHVLSFLDKESLRKTIRFSFSYRNTIAEIDYVIEQLKKIIPVKITA